MNGKLYAACATMSDDERKRDRGAFFRSIHGTLNHLLLADSVWMGRFDGKPFTFRGLDQELYASFDELRAARVEMDERIDRWARGLTDAALGRQARVHERDHEAHALADALDESSLHFFNHQTHHRGQLTTLLSQAGVDYGVTDLFLLPGLLDR